MITTDRKPAMDNSVKNSWGMRFQAAREGMNLSEKDAAARLHLKPHIINIIESERFGEGPPVIFMRGYIRSYGRLLNLSEKDLTQALAQFDFGSPTAPSVPSHFRMQENNSNSSSIWSTAFVVLVLAALVGVWWWNSHVRNASVIDVAGVPAESSHAATLAAAPAPEVTPAEAFTPTQLNNALANPTPAPSPNTTTAAVAPAPEAVANSGQKTPVPSEIPPQPKTPPAAPETSRQVAAAIQSVDSAIPAAQPEPATVTNHAAASTAPAVDEETRSAAATDVATTEDLTDDEEQAPPVKTHIPKNKLPNLADSEMAVPEEGLENEPG